MTLNCYYFIALLAVLIALDFISVFNHDVRNLELVFAAALVTMSLVFCLEEFLLSAATFGFTLGIWMSCLCFEDVYVEMWVALDHNESAREMYLL